MPAGATHQFPGALGWLYVNRGSNLGAAFLFKSAVELGMSESFGARHLAPRERGEGYRWRTFTRYLDAIPLSYPEKAWAIAGAARLRPCRVPVGS
ncbi:hypothetical protein DSL92_06635 [Billgrantia gudaonensis]|uniref:Uncharacterized protein n=1 Tax=Billgrantia gudaonensis TaxID=376427 RepID=A0A3S0R4U2_9GAMM|nr:hypothetical protein DSL92_06635 [Halomonas gudaonensis]